MLKYSTENSGTVADKSCSNLSTTSGKLPYVHSYFANAFPPLSCLPPSRLTAEMLPQQDQELVKLLVNNAHTQDVAQ